jgi:DUF4097 and DUF4098 domain-containing protein YvlB
MKSLFVRYARMLLLVPALVAAAGCDLAMADLKARETLDWRKTYQLQPGGRVEISNINGRIAVEPSASQAVEVVAEKIARAASQEAAKAALDRVEISEESTASAVRIETKIQRATAMFAGNVEVTYRVRVPAGADVRFTTVNGGIEVARLEGRIDVETVNGGINAREITGTIEASTVNGGIDVDVARVASGGVKLESTNGGIKLRLPSDARADISARVVNGGIDADGLSIETAEKSRRRFEGRMNGGGARVDIQGTNGGIRIAARD